VSAPRPLLRPIVSSWAWTFFLTNTVSRFTVGLALSKLGDPHRAFGRAVRSWAVSNMRYGFFRCDVEPHAPVPSPAILLVNHQHFFDIELVAALVPPPLVFAARVEVASVPLIGSVLRRGGHVLLARGGGAVNERAFDAAAARLEEGARVVFFGEGTRSQDGSIRSLRSGAFRLAARTGVPLVPLVLAGTRATFPSGLWPIVPSRMAAAFLPPRAVRPDEARSTSVREAVREEMAAALAALAAGTGPRI
jgi:1-acyl-sn-glycerol-3-phosphate acyltransferase